MFEPGGAAEGPIIRLGRSRRREPVGPFPAEFLPEHGTQILHPFVAGRRAQGPGGGPFLVRVMNDEDIGIGFFILGMQVGRVGIVAKAPRLHAQHVDTGLALDHPMGQLPARAARRRNAKAVAFIEPKIAPTPGRTNDRAAVRCVGDGAVIDPFDADLAEGRHSGDGRFDMGGQTVEILGEQFVLGTIDGTMGITDRRPDLVRPQQQAAGFLTQIPRAVGFPQHAHFGQAGLMPLDDLGVWLGDDILMFDRQHGDVEADHGAGAPGIIAGGRDDVFAGDIALVCLHQPFAIGLLFDTQHRGLAIDLGAEVAGTDGHGLGHVGGLDIAVAGMLDGADQPVDIAQGPDFLDVGRSQEFDLDTDGLGHAGILMIFVHAVAVHGQANIADLAEAHRLSRFRLQPLIELDRVFVDLPNRIAHIEQRQQSRRVPGRAGRQFIALHQHHIRPTLPGQLVQRGDAHNSAANHNHARLIFHCTVSTRNGLALLRGR